MFKHVDPLAPLLLVVAISFALFTPAIRMIFAPNLWCDYEAKATNQEFINNYKKANISYLVLDPDDGYVSLSHDGNNYFCADENNSVSKQVDMRFYFSLTDNNNLQLTTMNSGDLLERVKKEQFFFDAESLLAKCIKDANEIMEKRRQTKNSWEK